MIVRGMEKDKVVKNIPLTIIPLTPGFSRGSPFFIPLPKIPLP